MLKYIEKAHSPKIRNVLKASEVARTVFTLRAPILVAIKQTLKAQSS